MYSYFRTIPLPSSDSYDLIRANISLPPASPDARLARLFTQDFAISLNPSRSGSFRTAQGVSKYIVARCSEVDAGQCGRPLCLGFPVRAKFTQAVVICFYRSNASVVPPL